MERLYTPNCEVLPGMLVPVGVSRQALVVEYAGAAFHGFQKQATAPQTVQAALETALSRVAAEPISLVCAGRTDRGVHATRQVVHFDTSAPRPTRAWTAGVNALLPGAVRVIEHRPVPLQFHARFSARARSYRYVIQNRPAPPAIARDFVTWVPFPLQLDAMRAAAESILGEHDFSAFRASQCQARSPVRHLRQFQLCQRGGYLVAELCANAFLHHMVRNLMGSLLEIGRGARPVAWLRQLLDGRDRTRAAATAKPNGLYLCGVEYPAEFAVPSQIAGPDLW